MAIQDPALKLTYDDLAHLPADGRRHELIDGEHCVTPSPAPVHQGIVVTLIVHFAAYFEKHPAGRIYPAPLDVVLSDVDVVQPDLLFIAQERTESVKEKYVAGAPDLVIEILSETTRRHDEVTKRKLYERFRVREYWLFDPVLEQVKVYRQTGHGFGSAQTLAAEDGASLSTPLLPGLSIPLVKIFA